MEERTEQENLNSLIDSIFGTPAFTTAGGTISGPIVGATTPVLDAVLDAIGESKKKEEKYLRDNFSYLQEHIANMKKDFEDILDIYFPDRWEIQITRPADSRQWDDLKNWVNRLTFTDPSNEKEMMESLIRQNGYNAFHGMNQMLLLIHFPEITIKNSKRQFHLI